MPAQTRWERAQGSQEHADDADGSITSEEGDVPRSSSRVAATSDVDGGSSQAGFDREALLKKVGARKGAAKKAPAKNGSRKDSKRSQKGKKVRAHARNVCACASCGAGVMLHRT